MAFAALGKLRAGALVIGTDPVFNALSEQLAALATRYEMPTVYQYRPFAAAGGLMSYGGSFTEPFRQVGIYTGRILKAKSRRGCRSKDRKGARSHRSNVADRARRQGDRMNGGMSAIGTKQTSLFAPHMCAFGGQVDIALTCSRYVR